MSLWDEMIGNGMDVTAKSLNDYGIEIDNIAGIFNAIKYKL